MNKIILDANVLYSNRLRGLFLWMSWGKICEIIWSDILWEEVIRNYSKDQEKEKNFRETIEKHIFTNFQGSMRNLNGYKKINLPDPDDEHVVALAIQENVKIIVTFNLKDFPESIMKNVGISCFHPDKYLCDRFGFQDDDMKKAIREHMIYLKETKPKKETYLNGLRSSGVQKFVDLLEAEDDAGNLFPEVWP